MYKLKLESFIRYIQNVLCDNEVSSWDIENENKQIVGYLTIYPSGYSIRKKFYNLNRDILYNKDISQIDFNDYLIILKGVENDESI